MKSDNRWTIYFKDSALFHPFCCPESIITYLRRAVSFSHRASQVEPSPLLLDTFSKSSTLPWKNWQQTASWSFCWSFSPATIDLQNSPSSDFYMAGGNQSSRPKVISPEVISPGTRVMLPEIHSHVAWNPTSCRPQFYQVYKLEEKVTS